MIIGICGYKGSGKSTVCETAINLSRPVRPFVRIGFSDPLIAMLAAMGIPGEILHDKSRWDEPLDMLCGRNTRYACRTLGTEWGRNYIGRNVWTGAAMARADELVKSGNVVILDNVRMWDEVEAIRARGGRLIAFKRRENMPEIDLSHESEQAIDDIMWTRCKFLFENDGHDLQRSANEFRELLDKIVRAAL